MNNNTKTQDVTAARDVIRLMKKLYGYDTELDALDDWIETGSDDKLMHVRHGLQEILNSGR